MQVQVWSDVVCPWCYIGRRRLERALERFEHAGEVEVLWRSFQLDPSFPRGVSQPVYDALAQKMGASVEQVRAMTEQVTRVAAQEGLEYRFESGVMVNTFDVHRLLHLARERGLGGWAHECFMRAQLVLGRDLSQARTLVEVAAQAGLEEGEVRRVLEGRDYAQDVREDIDAARRLGAGGVPFFVIDETVAFSGAQPVEVLVAALDKAHRAGRG
ncbi:MULTISPECIES: DsbA family oxidoreductase [Nocardiopsis]|uniref:Disulfide bond formation protein DsbA n=1 Tax=Nocardiopsis sinuspersici TaxID=501010 RepID=A0A1V3BZ56_9ACTN|nr:MULTISPECIES: DsbA family oxidoreductase [Nocardiopsis]OOC53831.1 disulfide bond formation protein DsbA [Nocardiopsis sinuspersici]